MTQSPACVGPVTALLVGRAVASARDGPAAAQQHGHTHSAVTPMGAWQTLSSR